MCGGTMGSTALSVRDFERVLADEVPEIAREHSWDFNKEAERGFAFQLWFANVVAAYEQTFDTEPGDALLMARDLGADLVFDDETNQHLLVCQCKYQGRSKKSPVVESEVRDFFRRHDSFMQRSWVQKHGSPAAIDALGDYDEKIKSGYSVRFYFVSTGDASPRIEEVVSQINEDYRVRQIPVSCELLDFARIKDYYVRSRSLEASIPDEITMDLPSGRYMEKNDPYPTVVAILRGNALRNLYKRHKESLFAFNIRNYLGNRGINAEIVRTANERGQDFFYFNNGVSAICTDYSLEKGRLVARGFQVINGAQTVGALNKARENGEVEVLFRLTKAESVKTERGFNRDVIKYNNTQNLIKVSDFRSNDPIQLWLERRLLEQKATGPMRKVRYARRRGSNKGVGQAIRLEDLAKIRYAFLVEPTEIHAAPKRLWTMTEDGGLYESAFGLNGKLVELWPEMTYRETLLAIALFLRIVDEARALATENEDLKYVARLKFHLLALAGEFVRARYLENERAALVSSEQGFGRMWDDYWDPAFAVVDGAYEDAHDQDVTTFAFVRSAERWQRMKSQFEKRLAARRVSGRRRRT
jgi:hypothetical protein